MLFVIAGCAQEFPRIFEDYRLLVEGIERRFGSLLEFFGATPGAFTVRAHCRSMPLVAAFPTLAIVARDDNREAVTRAPL